MSIARHAYILVAASFLHVASASVTPRAALAAPTPAPRSASDANFYVDKVAVVSGAGGGVGLALCTALLERGAKVYAGLHRAEVPAPLQTLQATYPAALIVGQLDVGDAESVKNFVTKIKAPYVDVLINAAGINVDEKYKLMDPLAERFAQSFAINATGAVRLTQALGPLLHNCGLPRVVNLSSVMGSIGENGIGGSPAYRMSKAALNMFTRELAIEEPALVALSLHPGWVKTKMGGVHADIAPEKAAQGILQVVARAKRKDSGRFFRYSGEPIAW